MKRRGTKLWSDMVSGMIDSFRQGDIVAPTMTKHTQVPGVVQDVDKKAHKVTVAWNGGAVQQHDPDEVMPHPRGGNMKDMPGANIEASDERHTSGVEAAEPEERGLDEPRGGGFTIMKDLVEDTRTKRRNTAKSLVRQAMYWNAPNRVYRLNQQEQQEGAGVTCPKCKDGVEKEKYTRSESMYRCPNCGFKVPSGKVVTKKEELKDKANVEIEIDASAFTPRRARNTKQEV